MTIGVGFFKVFKDVLIGTYTVRFNFRQTKSVYLMGLCWCYEVIQQNTKSPLFDDLWPIFTLINNLNHMLVCFLFSSNHLDIWACFFTNKNLYNHTKYVSFMQIAPWNENNSKVAWSIAQEHLYNNVHMSQRCTCIIIWIFKALEKMGIVIVFYNHLNIWVQKLNKR